MVLWGQSDVLVSLTAEIFRALENVFQFLHTPATQEYDLPASASLLKISGCTFIFDAPCPSRFLCPSLQAAAEKYGKRNGAFVSSHTRRHNDAREGGDNY
jgi:hypothetical protein